MIDDNRTPPHTPSSALHRLNLQASAKTRMREIARELQCVSIATCEGDTMGIDNERHLRILGEELERLIGAL